MDHRATFTCMQDGTRADREVIGAEFMKMTQTLPDRALAQLRLLDDIAAAWRLSTT